MNVRSLLNVSLTGFAHFSHPFYARYYFSHPMVRGAGDGRGSMATVCLYVGWFFFLIDPSLVSDP